MTTHSNGIANMTDKKPDLVQRFGLNCYQQEFEICDHFEMLNYIAYSGMPSRYPH